MLKKMKKAFTITELVIVIAVIAILAAVLIPTFTTVVNNANESAAMQEAKSEWTSYSAEILVKTPVEDQDYLFVNNDYIFIVANGNFEVDPEKVTKTTNTEVEGVALNDKFSYNNVSYTVTSDITTSNPAGYKFSEGIKVYQLTDPQVSNP